jgi:hypothetical protein
MILMGGAVLANFATPSRNPGLALMIFGAALVMIFVGYSGRRG